MSTILVTGATGRIGSRLVRQLLDRGETVRAFSRKARSHFDGRAEVVAGDFMDKASLARAVEGVSRVYLVSAGPDLEAHEANVIDAARAAGIELIVKQSVAGAQNKTTGILQRHRAGEERIEKSGLPFVFLRPDWFATNALFWADSIKSQDIAYGALGETSVPVIDPDDIACVAATVLTTPGHAGQIYELTGPESLTSEQQVATLAAVLGRPLKYVNVTDQAAGDAMLRSGMDPRQVEAMIGLFQVLRNLGYISPTDHVKSLLGREPLSFRHWAEANVQSFRGGAVRDTGTAV
jgi:(4-alkanoyl-5-oxo-2,5-dihydrofuran-3-yl)methyl phosphate reductase